MHHLKTIYLTQRHQEAIPIAIEDAKNINYCKSNISLRLSVFAT